jgi:hypothetical protein
MVAIDRALLPVTCASRKQPYGTDSRLQMCSFGTLHALFFLHYSLAYVCLADVTAAVASFVAAGQSHSLAARFMRMTLKVR